MLILLPATGEKPQSIFKNTVLSQLLTDKGYVTIRPEVPSQLFPDAFDFAMLNQLLKTSTAKYQVSDVVIGGLSSGGAIAVRYAEYPAEQHTAAGLKGVIVIDALLDLQRIYASAQRQTRYPCGGLMAKQDSLNQAQLNHPLGGAPETKREAYLTNSAFSAGAADGGTARFLRHMPLRLYSEPDLDFIRKQYCADLQLTDLNATDLMALHQFLLKAGNTPSEYIATRDRGFHSWNIMEPDDAAAWIMGITG